MPECRRMRVVMLGSGPSTGVPNIGCLSGSKKDHPRCAVCNEANFNPESKNWRGNPSLVATAYMDDGTEQHILIDCGKTFRQSVSRFFPKYHIRTVNAVLLTHDHADAVLGIDDLRDLQTYFGVRDDSGALLHCEQATMQVMCSDATLERMRLVFPYLFPKEDDKSVSQPAAGSNGTDSVSSMSDEPDSSEVAVTKGTKAASAQQPSQEAAQSDSAASKQVNPRRFVSKLDWQVVSTVLDDDGPDGADGTFTVCGIEIQPLRLLHGGTYVALGFVFGPPDHRIAYLSDVKAVPDTAMKLLQQGGPIHTLFLDALFPKRTHDTHMSLPESIDFARKLRPKRTILTGMTHEFNYYVQNAELAELKESDNLHIEMGYDGLCLSFEWTTQADEQT